MNNKYLEKNVFYFYHKIAFILGVIYCDPYHLVSIIELLVDCMASSCSMTHVSLKLLTI